jgi:hypothetical protein
MPGFPGGPENANAVQQIMLECVQSHLCKHTASVSNVTHGQDIRPY